MRRRLEDPLLERFKRLTLQVASKYNVKVLSIILYGSRAYGNPTPQSDYDFFILLDETSLLRFTQFTGELRLRAQRLDSLDRIKVYANTLKNFRRILKGNPLLGAFAYVVATMGVAIYDPKGAFRRLRKAVEALPPKEHAKHVKRCLEASRKLGSEKWVKYWAEKLKRLQA